jgi:hypothetical protein
MELVGKLTAEYQLADTGVADPTAHRDQASEVAASTNGSPKTMRGIREAPYRARRNGFPISCCEQSISMTGG